MASKLDTLLSLEEPGEGSADPPRCCPPTPHPAPLKRHPKRLQLPIRSPTDIPAMRNAFANEVKGLRRQPLPRKHVGDARRIGSQALGGDAPGGGIEWHHLLGPEECFARSQHHLAPGRRRRQLLVRRPRRFL